MNKASTHLNNEIGYWELMWLDTHGGRDSTDLFIDDKGRFYVLMDTASGGEEKVYIPRCAESIKSQVSGIVKKNYQTRYNKWKHYEKTVLKRKSLNKDKEEVSSSQENKRE